MLRGCFGNFFNETYVKTFQEQNCRVMNITGEKSSPFWLIYWWKIPYLGVTPEGQILPEDPIAVNIAFKNNFTLHTLAV